MKTFLIDAQKCIDCRNCQIACKDEHCDNDWAPIAAPQGAGQFWMKVLNREAGSGARIKMQRLPLLCQQCANPACLKACGNDAIYKRPDGIVIIDPELCKGCGDCSEACAYGVIYRNDDADIYQKCTMCAHLIDAGASPRCATACPTDALSFVESDGIDETRYYARIEKLHSEYGTMPRVGYVNLPRPFIAGEVCTADDRESVEGAEITATHQITGDAFYAESDPFGEFYLEGLAPGFYRLKIAKTGYSTKTLANICVEQSVNVEEVRLYPSA